MEFLYGILASLVGSNAVVLVFVGLVVLAVFVLLFAIMTLLGSYNGKMQRRLRGLSDTEIELNYNFNSTVKGSDLDDALDPLSRYIVPQGDKERVRVQQLLKHAGFHRKTALTRFYAIKSIFMIGLPVIVLAIFRWFPDTSSTTALLWTLGAGAFGMVFPSSVLDRLTVKRQRLLRHGFPDFLDLLVVCIEAGMGLDAALQKVTESLEMLHPELSAEFVLVNAEIRLGRPRIEALKDLVDRTGLAEIRGLMTVMDQSSRFGTSLAEALRVYAEEFRDKRRQDAEEMAAKIGAKLIFPMLFCIWPSFFVVAVGPAMVQLLDSFIKV